MPRARGVLKGAFYFAISLAIIIVFLAVAWFYFGGQQALPIFPGGCGDDRDAGTGTAEGEAGVPRDTSGHLPEPLYRQAVVAAVGDIMVHKTQYVQAYNSREGNFDFAPGFEVIAPYLQRADLIVGNLETTFGGEKRGYSAYPRFNSPDEFARALREAGFDLLCTVNNHCLDTGEQGLYRTIDVIGGAGMKHFGTYRSSEERDSPLVVEVNGIRLAFLAYTYGTNGLPIPEGREHIVNLLTKERVEADIGGARREGADLIILYLHWGEEYLPEPAPEQKRWARIAAEAGADIILGSHPHVIQPMEYIDVPCLAQAPDGGGKSCGDSGGNGGSDKDGATGKRVFVAYSMGNFLSNQHRVDGSVPSDDVEYGLILYLHLGKNINSGESFLRDVEYELTWVDRSDRHRILPLCRLLDGGELSEEVMALPVSLARRLQKDCARLQDCLKNFAQAGNSKTVTVPVSFPTSVAP